MGDTLETYAIGQDKQFLDIKAKSGFTAVIHAPNADVDLYAKGNDYGSVIDDSFTFDRAILRALAPEERKSHWKRRNDVSKKNLIVTTNPKRNLSERVFLFDLFILLFLKK